jgi:hypothetical protein
MKLTKPTKDEIQLQRDAFAILACKTLGKTVEEAAQVLAMDANEVRIVYAFIDAGRIDFDSNEF